MTVEKRSVEAATDSVKKPKFITEFFAQANSKPRQKPKITKTKIVKSEDQLQAEVKTEETVEAKPETNVEVKETPVKGDLEDDTPSKASPTDANLDLDYTAFLREAGFNKEDWINTLTEDQKQLLDLEIRTLHITWLAYLHQELTKPYFLKLKRFLQVQMGNKTVFPPPKSIYSWSHLTPLPEVKCLILGQDPYHNFNQAHGLAFLVLEPTRPPPSLLNIYKTLKIDFPLFQIPDYKELSKQGRPGGGDLTKWAKRGVLMLNACLTVEAHKANSHAKQGWESFTEEVIRTAITYAKKERQKGFVIMAWGSPAQKRVANFGTLLNSPEVPFLVLKTVHPSPLSASRGFFELKVFKTCNEWLDKNLLDRIDWGLLEGNSVTE